MGAVAWGLWPTPRFPSHQSTIIRVRASPTDSSRPWGARSIASLGPRARHFRVFLIGRHFQTPSACLKAACQTLKSPPFSILLHGVGRVLGFDKWRVTTDMRGRSENHPATLAPRMNGQISAATNRGESAGAAGREQHFTGYPMGIAGSKKQDGLCDLLGSADAP